MVAKRKTFLFSFKLKERLKISYFLYLSQTSYGDAKTYKILKTFCMHEPLAREAQPVIIPYKKMSVMPRFILVEVVTFLHNSPLNISAEKEHF